jgi:DNA-binding transcriptional MerR regulator
MKEFERTPKQLRIFYSAKELSTIMDISYQTLHEELRRNTELSARLSSMGRNSYRRFSKSQVLEIFRVLGFPPGYEHYEVR